MTWRSRAACKGRPPSWWFALPATPEADLAAAVCAECPVAVPCAEEGRAHKELGRWGTHVRLVEKQRAPRRTEIVPRVKPGRYGLFRCRECCDLPFLSEYALLVHRYAAHREGVPSSVADEVACALGLHVVPEWESIA